VLPIDDEGLRVTPLKRDEVLYASANPDHLITPPTIADLASRPLVLYDAHSGWRDPTRRQLAERARLAAVDLDAVAEVEQVESALTLVAAGVGDSFVSRAVAGAAAAPGVGFVPFADPLFDTIALVRRTSAALSPATAELVRLALDMVAASTRLEPIP
jgi:DNA-binding transcriptional LysR family regulator